MCVLLFHLDFVSVEANAASRVYALWPEKFSVRKRSYSADGFILAHELVHKVVERLGAALPYAVAEAFGADGAIRLPAHAVYRLTW
jgi:hypothetical protein